VAKAEMVCPFSGKLCRECPVYCGRHYYLCFARNYRGYVEQPEKGNKARFPFSSGVKPSSRFDMPSIPTKGTIDPFTLPLRDINE